MRFERSLHPPSEFHMLLPGSFGILTTTRFRRLSQVPLSAFIVEDMMELVQAHATYRFVILDEESERPRILVCLIQCKYGCTLIFI